MNAAMKTTLAAVVVVTLILSSVGVTYSWFSASQEYTVEIGTATFDVGYSLYSDDSLVTDNSVDLMNGATNNLVLSMTNNNDVPVAFEASFTVPRYIAYSTSDHAGSGEGELRPNGDGSYTFDEELTLAHRNGYRTESINALTVDFANSGASTLVGTNSTFTTIISGTTYYVVKTSYSATYSDIILPHSTMNIPIIVNTTRTVGNVTYTYTEGSTLDPIISAESIQINSTGSVAETSLMSMGDTYSGLFDLSQLNGRTSLVFSDTDDRFRIALDWQSLRTSDLSMIHVVVSESSDTISISVTATDTSNADVELDGRISYSISIGDRGVTSVMSGENSISCTITEDENDTTVTFSDIGSRINHTIGLTGGS